MMPGPAAHGRRHAAGHFFDWKDSETMLVLSRKPGHQIHVGTATITVLRIAGGGVRLGIDAPAETIILRDELAPLPTDSPDASIDERTDPCAAASPSPSPTAAIAPAEASPA
jgi:carbon storage regulator